MTEEAPGKGRTRRRTLKVDEKTSVIKKDVKDEQFVLWQNFIREELKGILRVFYAANGCLLAFVSTLLIIDCVQIFWVRGEEAGQLHLFVTEKVILTLIAATAAQLGAMAFAVGAGLTKASHRS